MNCLATFLLRSAFWTARSPWLLSNCVSCFHYFCGRRLATSHAAFSNIAASADHRSQRRSPQHRRLFSETVVKPYCNWFPRPWPLPRYHLNRRPVPESKWTFMPKSEEIHPSWCGHISRDWMNSVNLSSDLWPAIITVQLMLAARWEFYFNLSLVEKRHNNANQDFFKL